MQIFSKAFTNDPNGKDSRAALGTITHNDFYTTLHDGQHRSMAKDSDVVQKTPRGICYGRHPLSLSDPMLVESKVTLCSYPWGLDHREERTRFLDRTDDQK